MAEKESIVLSSAGLWTNSNEFTQAPEGALAQADNVIIRSPGVVATRPGLEFGVTGASLPANTLKGGCVFTQAHYFDSAGRIIANSSTVVGSDAGPARNYGFAQSVNNLYTSNNAFRVYRTDRAATASNSVKAGIPRGLEPSATALSGTSGFAAITTRYAYRVVWGYRDYNDTVHFGPPSGRFFISNPGAAIVSTATNVVRATNVTTVTTATAHRFIVGQYVTMALTGGADANFTAGQKQIASVPSTTTFTYADVAANATSATDQTYTPSTCNFALTILVPSGLVTGSFYQVYRSAASTSDLTEPDDELQLVYEATWTSGTTVSVTDTIPDSLRGASLYTNESQEGILQASFAPPTAQDIVEYKGSLLYANTQSLANLTINLLAVTGSNALAANDTITIGGVTYTAKTAESVGSREFQLYTTGTATQNIQQTALSLIRIVNQAASNTTVYAYYNSGSNDLPGSIFIEQRWGATPTDFSVYVSAHGSAWSPALPTSNGYSSYTDSRPNRVYWSKTSQPEAVPVLNYVDIGGPEAIQRIVKVRDSVFVLKDDGIYRFYGNDPTTFGVEVFDPTVRIVGQQTAQVMDNACYCLSTRGVVKITDAGVQNVSFPIDNLLLPYFSAGAFTYGLVYSSFSWFAVADEAGKRYCLFIPSSTVTSSFATATVDQAYVFNLTEQGGGWTRWTNFSASGGFYAKEFNDFYVGDSATSAYARARYTNSVLDYYDRKETCAINLAATTTVKFVPPTGFTVAAGDAFYFDATHNATVLDADEDPDDPTQWIATMSNATLAGKTTMTVYQAIPARVQWSRRLSESPFQLKQAGDVLLSFRKADFYTANITFYTDLDQDSYSSDNPTAVYGSDLYFGSTNPWNSNYFAGVFRPKLIRTSVSKSQARANTLMTQFACTQALGVFELEGVAIKLSEGTPRGVR